MVNTIYLLSFVETPRKFIIAELSIRMLGSSSVLIILIITQSLTSMTNQLNLSKYLARNLAFIKCSWNI